MGQALVALVIFGVGESMSMTPVMDDMMHACGELADASVNSLSSLMASSFSLGQMIGPMMGSGLSSRYSFPWAITGKSHTGHSYLFSTAAPHFSYTSPIYIFWQAWPSCSSGSSRRSCSPIFGSRAHGHEGVIWSCQPSLCPLRTARIDVLRRIL